MAKRPNLSRRAILTGGVRLGLGTVAVGGVVGGVAEGARAAGITGPLARPADLPQPGGPRVVIIGGGWSGLTLAKYVKKASPDADVVLIERRSTFVSHPISNLWLAGLIDLEGIVFSYIDAARNNAYAYLNATVFDVDRTARQVFTDQGTVAYDFLVVAPGIDYDYAAFGIDDPATAQHLKTHYPAGFISGSEHITLREKIRSFEGGVFLLNAPPGIFRCSATPYERACVIASHIQQNNIAGKVVLVDPRPQPAVKPDGFLAAFAELYPDTIEYMASATIEGVDVAGKTVATAFDDIGFDDAAIYPRVRAARLIEDLGLLDPESQQKEARIDPFTYQVVGDERVFVTGDARNHPFSKSANVAYTEARYVARVIAARIAGGGAVAWESPRTICYSMVDPVAKTAITIDTTYKFVTETGQWDYDQIVLQDDRTAALGQAAFTWADEHFADMFR